MNHKRMNDGLEPMFYGLPSIDSSASSLFTMYALQVDPDDYICTLLGGCKITINEVSLSLESTRSVQ